MPEVSFNTEAVGITAVEELIGYKVTIIDKSLCRSFTAEWHYQELAAVIAMILAEGGFRTETDDNLFHVAMRAVKRTPGLSLF